MWFHFLDNTHILLFHTDGLFIYSINHAEPLCHLKLPDLEGGAKVVAHGLSIRPVAPPESNDEALFHHDPGLASLAITFYAHTASYHIPTVSEDREMYLLLASCSAISDQLSRCRSHFAPHDRSIEVPWNSWGHDTCRLIRLLRNPCSISSFASKCAVLFPSIDCSTTSYDLFIFEVLPSAIIHRDTGTPLGERYFEMTDELRTAQCLRAPVHGVHSTLPFRLTHRSIYYEDMSYDFIPPRVTLTDDGLLVAVSLGLHE